MALRKMNMARWEKLSTEIDMQRAKLLGWSPGYAASYLGITRQAVHKAIHRGDLDALIINDDEGKLAAFMIPDESLQAFKAKRIAGLQAKLKAATTG